MKLRRGGFGGAMVAGIGMGMTLCLGKPNYHRYLGNRTSMQLGKLVRGVNC